MTNRELLELAAKAARIKIDKSPYNGGGFGNTGFDCLGNAVLDWHNMVLWNPLADDGDALRLAVKLELDLYNSCISVRAIHRHRDTGTSIKCRGKNPRMDPNAATRLAIVRAAAEIGKSMEDKP